MGTFLAPKNEFLFFEEGPSVDVTLQWATYADASDQTSLSRIWGGIHPPADDLRGRVIGHQIATDAYELALKFFTRPIMAFDDEIKTEQFNVFPNPAKETLFINGSFAHNHLEVQIISLSGQVLSKHQYFPMSNVLEIDTQHLNAGSYILKVTSKKISQSLRIVIE
ncbi:MAG: T9SS type A sorting domain-containing protein [Fulvivirga sp.]